MGKGDTQTAVLLPVSKLGIHDCEVLVEWFAHYMDQDTRRRLMRELPLQYNKLHGREIVKVVFANGEDV